MNIYVSTFSWMTALFGKYNGELAGLTLSRTRDHIASGICIIPSNAAMFNHIRAYGGAIGRCLSDSAGYGFSGFLRISGSNWTSAGLPVSRS
jgi:hypothetical protein